MKSLTNHQKHILRDDLGVTKTITNKRLTTNNDQQSCWIMMRQGKVIKTMAGRSTTHRWSERLVSNSFGATVDTDSLRCVNSAKGWVDRRNKKPSSWQHSVDSGDREKAPKEMLGNNSWTFMMMNIHDRQNLTLVNSVRRATAVQWSINDGGWLSPIMAQWQENNNPHTEP